MVVSGMWGVIFVSLNAHGFLDCLAFLSSGTKILGSSGFGSAFGLLIFLQLIVGGALHHMEQSEALLGNQFSFLHKRKHEIQHKDPRATFGYISKSTDPPQFKTSFRSTFRSIDARCSRFQRSSTSVFDEGGRRGAGSG